MASLLYLCQNPTLGIGDGMLKSGAFYLGIAAGALVTWMVARRRGQLIPATPYYPRLLRRYGRRGQGWAGGQGGGAYR